MLVCDVSTSSGKCGGAYPSVYYISTILDHAGLWCCVNGVKDVKLKSGKGSINRNRLEEVVVLDARMKCSWRNCYGCIFVSFRLNFLHMNLLRTEATRHTSLLLNLKKKMYLHSVFSHSKNAAQLPPWLCYTEERSTVQALNQYLTQLPIWQRPIALTWNSVCDHVMIDFPAKKHAFLTCSIWIDWEPL